ncbi:unnamed protein product, partial [Ectocarpus sp. 6 AP-2014]
GGQIESLRKTEFFQSTKPTSIPLDKRKGPEKLNTSPINQHEALHAYHTRSFVAPHNARAVLRSCILAARALHDEKNNTFCNSKKLFGLAVGQKVFKAPRPAPR